MVHATTLSAQTLLALVQYQHHAMNLTAVGKNGIAGLALVAAAGFRQIIMQCVVQAVAHFVKNHFPAVEASILALMSQLTGRFVPVVIQIPVTLQQENAKVPSVICNGTGQQQHTVRA